MMLIILFSVVMAARISTIVYSSINAKRLIKAGGKEYHKKSTIAIMILMTLLHLGCLAELIIRKPTFNTVTIIGLSTYFLSMIVLAYVLVTLGKFWTMKVIIAKDHQFKENFLFRVFKHPNYYLNMFPEILSLVLITQAYITGGILLVPFIVAFYFRIKGEEEIMRKTFESYK